MSREVVGPASESMLETCALIRANGGISETEDIAAMRQSMETQQAALQLPADVGRENFAIDEIPACRIVTPSSREEYGVLYLHGGGYVMGSLDTHQELMARIARATRATVIGLDYRLAPEHPWPAAVEDALAAWQWMQNAGFLPSRCVVAGDSAGGGLAAALLAALSEQGRAQPAGVYLVSPWTDLTASGASVQTRADADPMINKEVLLPMAAYYRGAHGPDEPTISPLFADPSGWCPLLIQVGDAEVLLDDAVRLYDKAANTGVDAMLQVYEDAFHVFQAVPYLPEAELALQHFAAFFDRVSSS